MPRGTVYRHEVVNTPNPIESPGDSLVASAKTYQQVGGPGAQSLRTPGRRVRNSSWENELWDLYDLVPEFRSGCSYVGNLLSKAILLPMQNGKPTTNQQALDAMASLFGGSEGQEEMLRLLGVNFTVAGEAFVVGTPNADPTADESWQVVAAVEVQGETTKNMTVEGVQIAPGTLVIRLWKAHPRYSTDSDCPARALLPTLTEIVRLNQVVASQADSRLKGNGILFVPSELEMPSIPVTAVDDVTDDEMQSIQASTSISDGLTARLVKVASIAMMNRDSAAAAVPIVIAAPGEYLEKVQWIDFWTGFDEYTQALRKEARTTVGVGLDMPPEALTGTGDMNHWSAWQTDESGIKVHTEPLLNLIVSSLTSGYLQPILKAWGVPDYQTYTIEANTAAMRLRPDRSKEAMELWDRGAISLRTLLVENGFDPDTDLPDEKEQMKWFLSQIARKTSATPDQLATALAMLGVDGLPHDVASSQNGALDGPSLEGHPTTGAPDPEDSEAAAVTASASLRALPAAPTSAFVVDAVLLAAEQSVLRALERSGNKLKARIGTKNAARARDLYLQVPKMAVSDCMTLLDDAWSSLDGVTYPGVEMYRYREALQQYALTLLRTQMPYDRGTLARHLLLELAEAA